jgi:hypothetical protein
MKEFIGNTSIRVAVPLLRDDVPVIPDVGSASYTLMDPAGVAVPGFVDVPLVTDAVTYSLSIRLPAEANQIPEGKSFERRSIIVSLTALGESHSFVEQYRLIPLLNHTVTPGNVREFIGVSKTELADNAIDITRAYYETELSFRPTVLSEALASGTLVEMDANEAIRMRAVIEVIPSIRQRMAQMQADGVYQFKRAEIGSLDSLEERAWERFHAAVARATGRQPTERTWVLKTLDADAVTGE